MCSKDSDVFNMLGNMHFETAPEKAIEYYSEGILANNKNAYNYNGLGVIYNSQSHYESAVDEFHRAIENNPADPDFHYNLAIALKAVHNNIEAEKSFKTALQIDSSHFLSY